MDRISALRNVEDALADFESGETDLRSTERRVVNILRTYATEFEDEGSTVFRASSPGEAESVVVVAESESQARERAAERVDSDESALEIRTFD